MNNLKTNTYALKYGTQILENADLNDYKTPGNYYCDSNLIASTLSNCPTNNEAFTMKVEYANGLNYPRQTIRYFSAGIIATRYYNIDSSSWSEFIYIIPTTKE